MSDTMNHDERMDRIAEALVQLVISKGRDYGDSYRARSRDLHETLFAGAVRIGDKASRLYNLTYGAIACGTETEYESVEDTLRDLAGYCLLMLREMEVRGDCDDWPEMTCANCGVQRCHRCGEGDPR